MNKNALPADGRERDFLLGLPFAAAARFLAALVRRLDGEEQDDGHDGGDRQDEIERRIGV